MLTLRDFRLRNDEALRDRRRGKLPVGADELDGLTRVDEGTRERGRGREVDRVCTGCHRVRRARRHQMGSRGCAEAKCHLATDARAPNASADVYSALEGV